MKLRAFLELGRPLNLVMIALGVVVGYFLEMGPAGPAITNPLATPLANPFTNSLTNPLGFAILAAVLAASGGNALNDYFDWKIDLVVHPDRPLPSGRLKSKDAKVFMEICFAMAIIFSVFAGPFCLLIASLNVLGMISYELFLKKRGIWGNMMISYLTGSVFLFGGAAAGSFTRTLILFPLAFLAILGREVAKDIEDIKGDRSERESLPLKIGVRKAKIFAAVTIIFAVFLSPLPYLLGMYGISYLSLLLPADSLLLVSAMFMLKQDDLGEKLAKYGMLTGIVAFIGGVFI